jgi:hypothetical protein
LWIKRWRFRGIQFDGHKCNRDWRTHRHTATLGIREERSKDKQNLVTAFDLSTSMPQIEQAASRNRDSETTGGELRAEEEEQLPVRWVAPRLERKSGGRRLAGSRVRLALGGISSTAVPVVPSRTEPGPARISVLRVRLLSTAGLRRITGMGCRRLTDCRPRYQQAAKVGFSKKVCLVTLIFYPQKKKNSDTHILSSFSSCKKSSFSSRNLAKNTVTTHTRTHRVT